MERFAIWTAQEILIIWLKEGRCDWEWAFGKFGVRREENRNLVVISEGKRPLGIYRYRWDDDMEVGLQETEWGGHKKLYWSVWGYTQFVVCWGVVVEFWVSNVWEILLLAEEISPD